MADGNRERIKIRRKHETRTKEISKMIGEGGLGAEKYYTIKKDVENEEGSNDQKESDE